MTKDEALKLALEALDGWGKGFPDNWGDLDTEAITAIKEALAQPEQEPVATLWQHGETGRTRITMPDDITDCDARWFKAADLYTTPPQRTWVGLTDEEIKAVCVQTWSYDPYLIARAIEAKLRSKND